MATASFRARLERLRRRFPNSEPELPPIVAHLEDGSWIALVAGKWVPWAEDRLVPPYCKIYGFDPRGI